MRMVTFGIDAVFAALVLQLSDFGGREQSQKGQTQRQHYGCGLDVAVVDRSAGEYEAEGQKC